MDAHEFGPIAGWAFLHTLGLAAAWMSRWSLGRRAERAAHLFLGAAFIAIAGLAVFHFGHQFQLSLLSATTLGLMLIAAVYDFRVEDDEDPRLSRVMAAYEQAPAKAAPVG